jgi:hypothetical protein
MKIAFKLLIAFLKNEEIVISSCNAIERLICQEKVTYKYSDDGIPGMII